MRKVGVAALVALTTAGSSISAGAAEWEPAYLACMFTKTAFLSHSDLGWMRDNDEVLKVGDEKFEMVFASIDLNQRNAQLVGNGTAQVGAYRGGFDSLMFLERTPVGNTNLTTVFAPGDDGVIHAVTSRHIADLGGYMASQMLGTCKDRVGELPGAE